ncbi:MAG: alpha/beta hydrolase [Burkholderiaceae bacterium]
MNARTQVVMISGPAGGIDTAIDVPAGPRVGLAVVAHPHPLYGGTRDNKVVMTLARTFASLGYLVMRPNFRGVGASAGDHDEGRGETDDLINVTLAGLARPELASSGGQPSLVLAGFSFGAFVQARVAAELAARGLRIQKLVLVGTAVSRFDVPRVRDDTLLIHGEVDDTVPLAGVLEWARQGNAPVVVIPGADHFFHRKLVPLKRVVLSAWGRPAGDEPEAPAAGD